MTGGHPSYEGAPDMAWPPRADLQVTADYDDPQLTRALAWDRYAAQETRHLMIPSEGPVRVLLEQVTRLRDGQVVRGDDVARRYALIDQLGRRLMARNSSMPTADTLLEDDQTGLGWPAQGHRDDAALLVDEALLDGLSRELADDTVPAADFMTYVGDLLQDRAPADLSMLAEDQLALSLAARRNALVYVLGTRLVIPAALPPEGVSDGQ
ncbi:MAG TPA: hypothetical protein VLH84_05595 [Patescibacteria group bacterium]|nr:hypothetical protein [Patescibacteria group bacterium]